MSEEAGHIPRSLTGEAGPEREHDGLIIGGLMRCCLETLDDLYPDGPAKMAEEGQTLQCKYSDSRNHRMVFKEGFWRWDRGDAGGLE